MTRAHPKLSKREIVEAQLSGNNSNIHLSFVGNLDIGTPAQSFKVLFDTSTYVTWILSSKWFF
jgi:hypothetical protein